jgi:hypothetical protein
MYNRPNGDDIMGTEEHSLEKLIQDASPEMRSEIKDFIEFLYKRNQSGPKPEENKGDALREYGEEYGASQLEETQLPLNEKQTPNLTIAEVVKRMEMLSTELQAQVLTFVRALEATDAKPRGASGDQLMQFWDVISHEEGQQMADVITEGCERINADEW